jgi:hypothetical protein
LRTSVKQGVDKKGEDLQRAEVNRRNGHNVFRIHPIGAIERASGKRGLRLYELLGIQLFAAEAIKAAITETTLSI